MSLSIFNSQFPTFIKKEFYHVFRDKRTLLILFGMPLMQILLFGFALTSEVKNADVLIVDNAKDEHSEKLINKFKASTYFSISEKQISYVRIEQEFKKGNIKAAIIFPAQFSSDLTTSKKAQIQVLTDGTEPNVAKMLLQYITSITQDYQQVLNSAIPPAMVIIPEISMLYNEEGNGSINFVPGVMALILMIVCTALTSVAVVREKELGTMEALLVSPFKPIMVLVAKAVPYLVLSLINLNFILILAVFVMNVPMQGNIFLFFFLSMLFISTSLSMGLLISNATDSQQVALLLSMVGMLLPTLIFSGFIFPLENMPMFFQWFAYIVPARWYYTGVKSIMLKGLDISYIWKEITALSVMTIIFLSIAIKKFKIRLS
jgi:ABC-2 type transport system permease protein